jgi:EAL domain-containing protein (putative c-di-GMP-specific phosphodiesterase class I)/ActR/RegA family two-component response regulator
MNSRPLLIVDDDLTVCMAIAEGLRSPRDVIICRDIESAELVLEKARPSHIVSDVKLTGPFRFEGLDFVDHVRAHAPDTPVILITGHVADGLQTEALKRGVLAVLNKPFAIDDLERLLEPRFDDGGTGAIMIVPTIDDVLRCAEMTAKFQPIVSLADDRPIGFESLARLPGAPLLSNPELLFRYAARKGRVVELDLACMVRSLEMAAAATHSHLLFINMHPDVLNKEGLTDSVAEAAERFDVSLDRVIIEITEQQQLIDHPALFANLAELRALGIRFAIDDFGVAYSHLTLIERIEPAFLKVSQDFGTDFEKVDAREKIVRNVQALARDFGARVILEGIESAATADAARERGLAFGQGYHFGRPADLRTFF